MLKRLQLWYIAVGVLLSAGLPFLFVGSLLPNAVSTAALAEAAEYVILDEEDWDFWAEVPGRMAFKDVREFYVYNCTNPEEVAVRSVQPQFNETGPFTYTYAHSFQDRKYLAADGVTNAQVSFVRNFTHTFVGDSSFVGKEVRVLNVAGMKRWLNLKTKPRFHMAIEGFFEMFDFARNNLLRDMTVKNLSDNYFNKGDNIRNLVKDLKSVSDNARIALLGDHHYGLLLVQNVYQWSFMCDTMDPYIEHEIMTFFNVSFYDFQQLQSRFCTVYMRFHDEYKARLCAIMPATCSNYNITFYQWLFGNLLDPTKTYKDFTFKWVEGLFEFGLYQKEFFNRLKEEYKAQFKNVVWTDKKYDYLLDTYYDPPDYKTDDASVLVYANMRALFEAGNLTPNPYKQVGTSEGPLDLSRFDTIAKKLQLSKEQAYMLYCYFDYYVNNTVLLLQHKGSLEQERIANYAAYSYNDIAHYYMDYLDVVIYSRALHFTNTAKSCIDTVHLYLNVPEVQHVMDNMAIAICNNMEFNTNLSQPLGWLYFLEACSFPGRYYYLKLFHYLNRAIPEFTHTMLQAVLFAGHSPFAKKLFSLKDSVKQYYNRKGVTHACDSNDFSHMCTKRQFFLAQFYDSLITLNPYPDAHLPSSPHVADWWTIIRPYIPYTLGARKETSKRYPGPILDREIETPVEFTYLKKQYGSTDLTRLDLFDTFNAIGIYDTDLLYALFLGLLDFRDRHKQFSHFRGLFFNNATRYLLRNVEFGPMLDRRSPDEVYFGYFNTYLEAEHSFLDYLRGDDCTLNPWIGYNPGQSHGNEPTFEHLKSHSIFRTGIAANADIRQYVNAYGQSYVSYRRLFINDSGDTCHFNFDSPFTSPVPFVLATDGLQFDQFGAKSPAGDQMTVFDPITFQPMNITRPDDADYKYKNVEVNVYGVEFRNTYRCPRGPNLPNSVDMTSYFQMPAIMTRARLEKLEAQYLTFPIVTYNRPLEKQDYPQGLSQGDSYYIVEPYTGITFKLSRKYMLSFVLPYDELYDRLPDCRDGAILPYYAMYETAAVSDAFVQKMVDDIISDQDRRSRWSLGLVLIGVLLVLGGVGMGISGFFITPRPTASTESVQPPNWTPFIASAEQSAPGEQPQSQGLLAPEETLNH